MDTFERAKRRNSCRGCGAYQGIVEKDGKDCDGMPGVKYKVCNNCGHAQPITKKAPKVKLK